LGRVETEDRRKSVNKEKNKENEINRKIKETKKNTEEDRHFVFLQQGVCCR
jgi:hypothetical protein